MLYYYLKLFKAFEIDDFFKKNSAYRKYLLYLKNEYYTEHLMCSEDFLHTFVFLNGLACKL